MAITKAPKLKTLKSSATDTFNKSGKYDPRPTIDFSETDLPEIKNWTIDGKYKLTIEVEMRGINEREHGNDKGKKFASFRVTKVGVEEKA